MAHRLTTRALDTECPACHGTGHTDACRPTMEMRYDRDLGGHVEVRTIQQGSGCLRCLGTGQLCNE